MYLEIVEEDSERDENSDCEVEYISKHRWVKGHLQYNVKWSGLSSENNTWVPEATIKDKEIVADYLRKNSLTKEAYVAPKLKKEKHKDLFEYEDNMEIVEGIRYCGDIYYRLRDNKGKIRTFDSYSVRERYPSELMMFLQNHVEIKVV